ncbi:IS982 family transposase [Actinoplanes sichuanensis]|uniref:IS982 family transposase n=1 Tax=Actinoplanes sichuanensis TaxID=512349 RepID=A0ABW4A2E4_9ACTN|nr:IS982 family transposase [Actinoplanes sichuanensis]BEL12839.1 IS982 family transposase [Actinoplanes sichuanensis]
MTADIDTLLTALYVFVDDHLVPHRRRPGRPRQLSDAELVCLMITQVLFDFPRERHWIRYAHAHLRGAFPYLPTASGYGKRVRASGPLLARVLRALADVTGSGVPILRLIDSTPVACGTSRETVKRSDLAGHAGYGYSASHSRFFWGMRLYLLATAEGMPVLWCLAHPKLDEREVMTALIEADHHLIADGQVILADRGFASPEFDRFCDLTGIHLVRPKRANAKADAPRTPAEQALLRCRQWIESIFQTLKGQLSLERHGARRHDGLFARVGQRLLALAAVIWHNTNINAPNPRSLIAYDH